MAATLQQTSIPVVKSVGTRKVRAKQASRDKWQECIDQACGVANLPGSCAKIAKVIGSKLLGHKGGTTFVAIDANATRARLRLKPLDAADPLLAVFHQHAQNVSSPLFENIMEAYSTHSNSDRWEVNCLKKLAQSLGSSSMDTDPTIKALEGKVKDGAHIVNLDGAVLLASQMLLLPVFDDDDDVLDLLKVNGHGAGTRHDSALRTAQWLGSNNIDGVVVVRSDAGGVHFMLPHGKNDPEVWYVDTCSDADDVLICVESSKELDMSQFLLSLD